MTTAATKTIQDLGVTLATKSKQTLVVSPITLPSGRTLADWATFTLTVRADPDWDTTFGRRIGPNKPGADYADPEGEGWTVVLTLAGVVVGATLEFAISEADSDIAAGLNRYAFDVYAEGGAAGRVELVPATWLTMRVRVRARV
jgi:hypothetical protein